MKSAVRALRDLGDDVVLAPERWLVGGARGVPLGQLGLVVERVERADARDGVVFDTTHARDGLLDVGGALRDKPEAKSAKKRAVAGDLVVSRLRPYLRQIAFVHPRVVALAGDKELAFSTEFYVLRSSGSGEDAKDASIAWLLPFLLSDAAQEALAGATEGGHHPRVPRESLFALRVPEEAALPRARAAASARVLAALDAHYSAAAALSAALAPSTSATRSRRSRGRSAR